MAEVGSDKEVGRKGSVRAFRLGGSGLERVLGDLEAPIMEIVWSAAEASVQEVCDALGPEHNYKTVMTVMNRLVEKGLLLRHKVSKAFLYSAAESKQAFMDGISRTVATGLVREFGATAIAQFVDVVGELGPTELAALEELVHNKVERRSSGGRR